MIRVWVRVRIWDRVRIIVRVIVAVRIRVSKELRWVYTFDAVKRFDTLSYASQMRIKAFCGASVYTFHAGISADNAREKA